MIATPLPVATSHLGVAAWRHTNFKAFLNKRRWTGNLDRHFVDDAERDPMLPDAASWEQLEAYLNQREADPQALHAARSVWEEYEKAARLARCSD